MLLIKLHVQAHEHVRTRVHSHCQLDIYMHMHVQQWTYAYASAAGLMEQQYCGKTIYMYAQHAQHCTILTQNSYDSAYAELCTCRAVHMHN